MSAPQILIRLVLTGSKAFGKACHEAWKQAVKNAKTAQATAAGSDIAGVGNATSGSATDRLTREQRITLDEAHLILNVKRGEPMEAVMKNYEHLFKANSPPEPSPSKPPQQPSSGGRSAPPPPPAHSHYLQSKVVRALERIEAEENLKVSKSELEQGQGGPAQRPTSSSEPPRSQNQSQSQGGSKSSS